MGMYRKVFKRIIDLVVAIVSLIVFSPIFVFACVAIKLDSHGSIFFQQSRVGRGKREFKVLKFRTMVIDAPNEEPTGMLKNPNEYITRVGKVLRKTSFDELPQLINIIVGDMSVVGPRPVIPKEYELIAKRDEHGVYDVRPGLTGWAQINGRDEVTVESKVRYDSEYANNVSFWFDVRCILKTIPLVLRAVGISEGERVDQVEEKI